MHRNVFNVWPKTTLLLPMWPKDAKRLDTPAPHTASVEDLIFTMKRERHA